MSKSWSREIKIDLGTFGSSRACHILAQMMNDNVIPTYEKHRTLAFINLAIYSFNNVGEISDQGVRYRAMYMMRDDYLARIENMKYPEKFRSFLKNVINYHSRRVLRI